MDTIKNLNLNEEILNLDAVTPEHIKTITKTLEEKYLTFWKHKLENSSKLTFYSAFKTDHNLENYLVVIKDPYKRKCLSRFRVGNHNLLIEIGRNQNMKNAYVKSAIQERLKMKPISSFLAKPMSNLVQTFEVH
jgi:hypothetical protein